MTPTINWFIQGEYVSDSETRYNSLESNTLISSLSFLAPKKSKISIHNFLSRFTTVSLIFYPLSFAQYVLHYSLQTVILVALLVDYSPLLQDEDGGVLDLSSL